MKTISDLCKKLNNPIRIELLKGVYTSMTGGANVGLMQDGSGLGVSGTSQYMAQLEDLGLIRRKRSGRYVNYLADWSQATPEIAEIAAMLKQRFVEKGDMTELTVVFGVLMNPFRARVINYLANGGNGEKENLIKCFKQSKKTLDRDLKPARDAGLLDMDDDDADFGCYTYHAPSDPIATRLIALAK